MSEQAILSKCLQYIMHSKHDITFNLNRKSDEYSDIGFCQEESLVSPDITANQLSVVTSGIITTNQDSENRLHLSNQRNEGEITKVICKCIFIIGSTLNISVSKLCCHCK